MEEGSIALLPDPQLQCIEVPQRIMFRSPMKTGRSLRSRDARWRRTTIRPKYMNSPETPIYSKGRVLYNLDRRKRRSASWLLIIVEGQMDCIACIRGLSQCGSEFGHRFTETQVRLLGRFSKDIVVNFDPDTAGAAATDKSLACCWKKNSIIRVLRLERVRSGSVYPQERPEAYAKALKGSAKYFDYLVERALKLFPTRSPEGKKNAVNFCCRIFTGCQTELCATSWPMTSRRS